jgi:hypothetical protein
MRKIEGKRKSGSHRRRWGMVIKYI